MTQIITSLTSYSEHRPEDGVKDNWAAEYAKREVDKHREAEVLDHPDGSVTKNKLSPDVRETIADAKGKSETAKETADNAKVMAQSAKDIADIAKTTADDALNLATEAVVTAKSADISAGTAKEAANAAEQRAISAETKADAAVVTAEEALRKSEDASNDVENHSKDAEVHITFAERRAWNLASIEADEAKTMTGENSLKLSLLEESVPSKVSQLENDSGYLTEHQDISGKADKPTITESTDTVLSFEFSTNHNTEIRTGELTTISFTFGNGEYVEDYTSGLSFDSGETPTAIDYTDSGILNWVGTDCVTSDGLSIFQPSANTHYDIVFYFNGKQFIGLVNGFVPATGNEAV